MAISQSSFRRILLSRLLLVSVPVLLIGVYITYRKARSAFLETARQNLTESAVRKGESINNTIAFLKANLLTASDSAVLQFGLPEEKKVFIYQLMKELPMQNKCIYLTELKTKENVVSTCKNQLINKSNINFWLEEKTELVTNLKKIDVQLVSPQKKPQSKLNYEQLEFGQLELLLTTPVYDNKHKIRYTLTIQTALLENKKVSPGSLAGYPVIISQKGTIIAHALSEKVGQNIAQEADAVRLKNLIGNAITGKQNFLHLFAFEKHGVELVAGYSSIPSPITSEKKEKWVILALSPLDAALNPLEDIQRVLLSLVMALIIVSILAILYISWELALPLEQLRDYALNKEHLHSKEKIPQNFKIKEFNQLAIAVEDMVNRLQSWGEEIISSWKEAQKANQLKNEFLATTSHELRTPLNGIIGCISIIKEGYCNSRDEELEFLQQADHAAVHLLQIIDDILDIAKIEAGKLSVTIEPTNLEEILTEVIDLQSIPIQKKGLKFYIEKLPNKIIVNADPAKLKQVLLNVISNSIKFTESGSITIQTRRENQRICITVKDTGIGIEPSQQDKLFRPFVMVDGSTTRQFGGTGLGLAISRNLIEIMNGNIALFSPGLGKGTIVEISLPIVNG